MNLDCVVVWPYQVHRDVKPENIIVDGDVGGDPRSVSLTLIDFGYAAVLTDSDSGLMTGVAGSPEYAAPEVLSWLEVENDADGAAVGVAYNASCDVWSVGITAHVMLCAQLPIDSVEAEPGSSDFAHLLVTAACNLQLLFNSPLFSQPSMASARDFIACCLKVDTAERLTAEELLEHPWLRIAEVTLRPDTVNHVGTKVMATEPAVCTSMPEASPEAALAPSTREEQSSWSGADGWGADDDCWESNGDEDRSQVGDSCASPSFVTTPPPIASESANIGMLANVESASYTSCEPSSTISNAAPDALTVESKQTARSSPSVVDTTSGWGDDDGWGDNDGWGSDNDGWGDDDDDRHHGIDQVAQSDPVPPSPHPPLSIHPQPLFGSEPAERSSYEEVNGRVGVGAPLASNGLAQQTTGLGLDHDDWNREDGGWADEDGDDDWLAASQHLESIVPAAAPAQAIGLPCELEAEREQAAAALALEEAAALEAELEAEVEAEEEAAMELAAGVERIGAKERLRGLIGLKSGLRLWAPYTQEMNIADEEAALAEQQKLMDIHERLGDSDQARLLRARHQSANLKSDMQAFKAANPG